MGKLINDLYNAVSALYSDNIISDFFSYMPPRNVTGLHDDIDWLESFADSECTGDIQLFDKRAQYKLVAIAALCAEYPEDLALFVMRAEIRKQQYG